MSWVVPNADAVTLGEIGGYLYSVSPRDDAQLGDEFVRLGGAVFPPTRVASSTPRRPFGQQESLTQEVDDEALDSGAVTLVKQAAAVVRSFLLEDEQKVIQAVANAASKVMRSVLSSASDLPDPTDKSRASETNNESIRAISWHPKLSVLAVAQQDGIVSFYDVASASWDSRVLEHPEQTEITSIEWARFSGGIIAVACR